MRITTMKKRPKVPPLAEIIQLIADIRNKRDAAKCEGFVMRSNEVHADRFYFLLQIQVRLQAVETDRRLTLLEKAVGVRTQKRSRVPARRKARSARSVVRH
jgi:hypothetical protein